jgi:hypothetical protein
MTELFIGTLSATAAADNDDGGASLSGAGDMKSRVNDMLAQLTDRHLDEALAAAEFPDGEWCLRRLDIRIALDPGRPGPAPETQWARAVVQELRHRIGSGSDDVLHFRRRTDALIDLASSLAAGRTDNVWAWRQLGLLTHQDPDPASAPAPALLAVLRRQPEQALAAVVSTVALHGASTLHRLLRGHGWLELAAIVAAAAGAPGLAATVGSSVLTGSASAGDSNTNSVRRRGREDGRGPAGPDHGIGGAQSPSRPSHPQPNPVSGTDQLADARTLGLTRRSQLARAFLRSGLRPEVPTAAMWALLAMAEADPGLLRQPDAPEFLRSLASKFLAATTAGPRLLEASRAPSATQPTGASAKTRLPALVRSETGAPAVSALDGAQNSGAGRNALPAGEGRRLPGPLADTVSAPAVGSPDGVNVPARTGKPAGLDGTAKREEPATSPHEAGRPTLWAGLTFLLATAADAGIPDRLLAEPLLTARPLRWVIHQLGQLLVPASPDDPAVLALAGLTPAAEVPDDGAPTAEERTVLEHYAVRWAGATGARLGRPHHEPFGVVAEIAFHRGEILAETGWIEVHLSLRDVDVDVRRAGLDIDPGWVPWLGVVVRFVYE